MINLNWRDASKELPENGKLCIVTLKNTYPFWQPFEFDSYNEIREAWDCYDDVKYWAYADEIPLPEELLWE